jgi:type IV secretory pathway TrbF-like protein
MNDDRLKRSNIFNWVENLRTDTTDGVSQRKAIDRVYAQIASGSEAQTFVSEYYRGDPPFNRAETETVSVEVKSVLPTSDRTYQSNGQKQRAISMERSKRQTGGKATSRSHSIHRQKTSGSGRMLAGAYLRAGMGGLVTAVKPEEIPLWRRYAAEHGRENERQARVNPLGLYVTNASWAKVL